MKKYISTVAIVLCALIINVKAVNTKMNNTTECSCCKNCKDEKCKELCKKWSEMTAEAKESVEGQKVKEECLAICKVKKCCSVNGKTATCEGMMEGKDCCKKK